MPRGNSSEFSWGVPLIRSSGLDLHLISQWNIRTWYKFFQTWYCKICWGLFYLGVFIWFLSIQSLNPNAICKKKHQLVLPHLKNNHQSCLFKHKRAREPILISIGTLQVYILLIIPRNCHRQMSCIFILNMKKFNWRKNITHTQLPDCWYLPEWIWSSKNRNVRVIFTVFVDLST